MQSIHICFPKGKFKALTFSYDDGRIQDRRLVDLFNRYQLKGTFHLNGGFLTKETAGLHADRIYKEEIRELYQGHEVACHTMTHPTIERTPIDLVVKQIQQDRETLEGIVGYPVRGLSYPNGSYSDQIKQILPFLGIDYARTVGGTGHFHVPKDVFQWQMTCHHNRDLLAHGQTFKSLHKSQYLYLMSVWGHSYEFDNDNNWNLIETFCEQMAYDEEIWYATNNEIVRYLKAAHQIQFTLDETTCFNPCGETIWLNVGGTIVDVKPGELKQIKSTPTIYLIGDSTVQSFNGISDEQGGWGEYFSNHFHAAVSTENYAIGGRSSRSFIEEGRLAAIDKLVSPGDYLIIQMGHNDASKNKPERYTDPFTTYIKYINQYVDFAHKHQAIPILIAPVPTFHVEEDQYLNDFEEYILALESYAKENNILYLPMMDIIREKYAKLDKKEVNSYYMCSLGTDDHVHFTKKGAKQIAEWVSKSLKHQVDSLSDYIL